MNKISVLIHGYNKNKKDMKKLSYFLESLNHKCILIDLPLNFHEVDYATKVLKEKIDLIIEELKDTEKINLIGHSTGGLVVRKYLEYSSNIDKINACIFIATPNNGSELADYACNYFKPFTKVFRTLEFLRRDNVKTLPINWDKRIKVGAIAGDRCSLLLGKLFLKDKNDGRVVVKSVYLDILDDFIVLPYGHKEIHYKYKTAKLIDNFVESGRFI